MGVCGVREVTYNDVISAKLAKALDVAGIQVVLTRSPGEDISLAGRAALANKRLPDLFSSVHHDSAQLKYLVKTEVNGSAAYQTIEPMAGYSMFASRLNPEFEQSYQFARLLGQALGKLGRPPTLHHA